MLQENTKISVNRTLFFIPLRTFMMKIHIIYVKNVLGLPSLYVHFTSGNVKN